MYVYFKSIRVILLTSELVAMGIIRKNKSIKVTPKIEKLSCAAERRGKCKTLPRKTAFFAAENRGP